jgi:hypothetical protein
MRPACLGQKWEAWFINLALHSASLPQAANGRLLTIISDRPPAADGRQCQLAVEFSGSVGIRQVSTPSRRSEGPLPGTESRVGGLASPVVCWQTVSGIRKQNPWQSCLQQRDQ